MSLLRSTVKSKNKQIKVSNPKTTKRKNKTTKRKNKTTNKPDKNITKQHHLHSKNTGSKRNSANNSLSVSPTQESKPPNNVHSPSKPPLLTLINPSDLNDNIKHYDDELYRKDPLFVRSKERQLREAKQKNLKHNKYLDVEYKHLGIPAPQQYYTRLGPHGDADNDELITFNGGRKKK
jgi:hypothetical protein|uniref:Uncharacterized protein n=1 Tax=viral metagenome TaxID=1070528 RepID=A0A6C0INT7_9ZZZZ